MEADVIEQAIDEELEKLNLNHSDLATDDDTDIGEDFTVSDGTLENDFPESVLTYVDASQNRVNTFEQQILGDLEENDPTSTELSYENHLDNILNELSQNPEEDLMRLKERLISEIEQRIAHPREVDGGAFEDPHMNEETECDVYQEIERQHIFEWRDLEEKLKKEDLRRLAEEEAEKEHHLNSVRKEEEKRRHRHEEFEEELRTIEKTGLCDHLVDEGGDGFQLEVAQQQEVIKRLEEQMEEERHAHEEAQQEKKRRNEECRCRAATKIQAAFRGILVRHWSKKKLIKRKEEERKRHEEHQERERRRKREEMMKREWEEERRRAVEEEHRQKKEVERRRTEYERAKEQERHRLEREHKLEEQKRKEEEAKRMEYDRERKEDADKRKLMEEERMEKRVEEEEKERKKVKRQEQEEKKKNGLQNEIKQEDEIKRLEEMESRVEKEKVTKRIEETGGEKMEDRTLGEEENRRRMKEQRREDEKKRKEEEKNKEFESELMQNEELKQLGPKEGKGNEGITIKKNEEKFANKKLKTLDYHTCSLKTDMNDMLTNCEKCDKEYINAELFPQPCLLQSRKSLDGILASLQSSGNGHHHIYSAVPTDNNSVTAAPGLGSEIEMHDEKYETDTRGHQCDPANSFENCTKDMVSICLPDSTEQKRLAWMMSCTPWCKLSMQNKRKGHSSISKKRCFRRALVATLPPLPVDYILKSGPWSALRQVTTVTLEDLPGYSLSTLSECSSLQSLTLRRCGLQALEGFNQCRELRHIDLQENSISYVDLGSLNRLEVLLLGRNRLTSIHGLDSVVNLTVLQLSHNIISFISGLGSLKRLQSLSVDHNQLISTRGLSDAFTLLYLDCSFNHLSQVEGLEHCGLLNTLDLRGNSLTELPVLKNHVLLRELYLDDNSISSLHGLESCWLPLLCCLSVAQNNVTQLPVLVDLLSLRTLDISHNCLSELRNICLSLQGCICLQELNLTDNPLQKENNWRSSVLAARPSLIKLNGENTGASVEPSVGSAQLWSFQALCQAHQHQLNSMLQRHSMEVSLTPSVLDAQLLSSNHSKELFQLAEEQRYAHEYGDNTFSEKAIQEPAVSSCLLDVSNGDLAKDVIVEVQPQSLLAQHIPDNGHKTQSKYSDADLPNGCAGVCISPLQKLSEEQSSEDGSSRCTIQAPRIDLKSMAAIVIQRCWRNHRQRRRPCPSETPEKTHGRLSPQKRKASSDKKPEPLNKDHAATVIQATWRGYMLRRRLGCALALAQISEGDEAFEEVDMDEFIFDEETMESDCITPHSDALSSRLPPYSEQLLLPKPPLPMSELYKNTPVLPWKPKHAWVGSEVSARPEQSLSPDHNIRMQHSPSTLGLRALSERSEKILEEWGIRNGSTALLMLKRAQKMKVRKQHQHRNLLNPAVRLALFRNHSEQPITMEACKRSQPKCKEHIKAGRAEESVEDALSKEPEQTQKHRMYQWLHTQAVQTQQNSATYESDHFLPEINPDILNGGRVQLVAGTRYRESPDSAERLWSDATGCSPPHNQQNHVCRPSFGRTKKEVLSPKRVTSAPSRKERISFRDNPVQLSGGWGGGKKRVKVNK